MFYTATNVLKEMDHISSVASRGVCQSALTTGETFTAACVHTREHSKGAFSLRTVNWLTNCNEYSYGFLCPTGGMRLSYLFVTVFSNPELFSFFCKKDF